MNADQRRGEKLKTWFSQNPDTFGENPGPFNRTTLQKINEGRFHPAGSWPSIPEGLVAGFASRLRRSPNPEGPSTPECRLRQELDRRLSCMRDCPQHPSTSLFVMEGMSAPPP